MIQLNMKRLLPYQMAVISNYQMDIRSTSLAHYFNRPDKDWMLVFSFSLQSHSSEKGEKRK